MLGAFALTLVAAGTVMAGALSHGEVDHVAKSVAPGLIVMALIYALGDVSGAHFNPVVTLAFTLAATSNGYGFPCIGSPNSSARSRPHSCSAACWDRSRISEQRETTLSDAGTITLEAVLTAFLVTVILNTASRHSLIGTDAALAVGATIGLCGLFAATLSGASMNPARSFGPALVDGNLGDVWPYFVGPLIGAVVAVGLSFALHPRHDQEESDAAEGEAGA